MSHSSPSSPQLRLSLSFFGARLPCEKAGIPTTATEPATDLLLREPTRADPGGRVLQREDICTVGGTALGLVQGARSGPLERLMFCRLQLLAVNYSMSRGGFGGLVASGRVLRNGVPGATAWDGMERGPGARKWRPIPRQRQLEASRFAPVLGVLKSSCRI
jgi:hypothetical protein